ncbi:MAG TPA: ferritin-like domain-containing protein [Steroidobacteraceae bacterium]|nr:ferritin-like domain-containing protein [Steroidobacteraceae bacterium]
MQNSTDAVRSGQNRTGQQTSPQLSREMNEVVQPVSPDAAQASALTELRLQYIREADPLGSVPAAFVDKLAERLAYERGGVRLYDAVIAKFVVYQDELRDVSPDELVEIRDEEASHAALLRACLEQLGADPTMQTPSADLVGVATAGFLQAATDPRTTLAQSLQIALAAELVDVASWEALITLAGKAGKDDIAQRFQQALERENEHLAKVRGWHETLTLASAESPSAKSKGKAKARGKKVN